MEKYRYLADVNMLTRRRGNGFTLIEILIVIVIVGILAALLIPQIQVAIFKAKQKGSMNDMNTISKALMSYVTDKGIPPENPGGPLEAGDPLITQLEPYHVLTLLKTDHWGNPWQIWTGVAVAGHFGIEVGDVGAEDFLIQSLGRDSRSEDDFSYKDGLALFYIVKSIADFNKDLILWNGSWIHAPHSAQDLN